MDSHSKQRISDVQHKMTNGACFCSHKFCSYYSLAARVYLCRRHRIAKQKSCLVYSVGSNGKVEFEKAVKEFIGNHCEIHSEFTFFPHYMNHDEFGRPTLIPSTNTTNSAFEILMVYSI